MNTLGVHLEVEFDGRPIPGFPFDKDYYVNDVFVETVSVASSTPSYDALSLVQLPTFDDTTAIRFLLLSPDKTTRVRIMGNDSGYLEIPAGGICILFGWHLGNTPSVLTTATTKILMVIGRVN
jgi:hypothetical protein